MGRTSSATTEGATFLGLPWYGSEWGWQSTSIYASTHFQALGIQGPVLIRKLRWRLDGGATYDGGVFHNVELRLATSRFPDINAPGVAHEALCNVDRSLVYQGDVVGVATPQPTTPASWNCEVTLSQPFLFDPSQGPGLVVDIVLPQGGWSGSHEVTVRSSALVDSDRDPNYAGGGSFWASSPSERSTWKVSSEHPVVEFTVDPAPAGSTARFLVDLATGSAPLAVTFHDFSFSDAPGGITAWQWDFEDDGIVDATVANPVHVYPQCGRYSVRLTVADGLGRIRSCRIQDAIRVGQIWATFSTPTNQPAYGVAPLTVSFLDSSSGGATSWAWDFDSDGIVDSTAQSPVTTYPSPGVYDVTLTAGNGCSTDSYRASRAVVVLPPPTGTVTLGSSFTGQGTGFTQAFAGGGVYFDVHVANPDGIVIEGLDVKLSSIVGTPCTFDVFATPSTWNGAELDRDRWALVSHADSFANSPTGTQAQQGRTHLDLEDLLLPPGDWGIAIFGHNANFSYDTASSNPSTYSNADATLTVGAAQRYAFSSVPNAPRHIPVQLHYSPNLPTAGFGFLAAGCPGSAGVVELRHGTQPRTGSVYQRQIAGLPPTASLVMMLTGLSHSSWSSGPLPFDLGPYGAPGCAVHVRPDAVETLLPANGTATHSIPIPASTTFLGIDLFQQALVLDPPANSLGISASHAGQARIGI